MPPEVSMILGFLVNPILLVVLFLVLVFITWSKLRVIVPTNEAHIIQSNKRTTSFGSGRGAGNTYMNWPSWVPKIGISRIVLPVSNFSIDLDSYEAYDINRTPFALKVSAFFRIYDTNVAAERISSIADLRMELTKILQGAIRKVLASREIHDIMNERATFGEQFTAEVKAELMSWGVETVKSVELMDIHDPKDGKSHVIRDIQNINTSKIDAESRVAVASNNRQAELAEIEAQQNIDMRNQEAQQIVGQRTAEKDKEVGISNERAKQAIEQEAAVTMQRHMEVLSVETQRQAEIKKEAEVVAAEADKMTTIRRAEGEKERTILVAQGQRDQSVLSAEGIAAEGNANALAEREMQLASVTAQTTLAKEVGENQKYQDFMVRQRTVEANEKIGIAQAQALSAGLEKADIKVIANGSSATDGINSLSELLTSKGGVQIGAALEGFMSTESGQKIVAAVAEKATANGKDNTTKPN